MKVLIISHNPFSLVFNNGKTYEAIFKDYLKEDLGQLFFSEMTPDTDFAKYYYRLTDKDVLKNAVCFSEKYFKENFIGLEMLNSSSQQTYLRNIFKTIPFLRDCLWKLGGKWKLKSLFEWIDSVRPDYIFFVAGQYSFSHTIARFLSKKYNLPLVVYFTDDYLIHPILRNWSERFQKRRMRSFYKKTLEQSSLRFVIGEKMADEYEHYFNKSFFPIMNMVSLKSKLPQLERDYITISYFGGLHLNRWQQIIRLGRIIRELCLEDKKLDVLLNVYSSVCDEKIIGEFKENGIVYKGFIGHDLIEKEFEKADILLHVESDDLYYRSLTKLSVSTKIPEYLSTGRCILGFGPLNVASIELLSENKIGYVISSEESDAFVKDKLRELFINQKIRNDISSTAYSYAIENFDPIKIREDFDIKIKSILNK